MGGSTLVGEKKCPHSTSVITKIRLVDYNPDKKITSSKNRLIQKTPNVSVLIRLYSFSRSPKKTQTAPFWSLVPEEAHLHQLLSFADVLGRQRTGAQAEEGGGRDPLPHSEAPDSMQQSRSDSREKKQQKKIQT